MLRIRPALTGQANPLAAARGTELLKPQASAVPVACQCILLEPSLSEGRASLSELHASAPLPNLKLRASPDLNLNVRRLH
jgi:hypothetical protein